MIPNRGGGATQYFRHFGRFHAFHFAQHKGASLLGGQDFDNLAQDTVGLVTIGPQPGAFSSTDETEADPNPRRTKMENKDKELKEKCLEAKDASRRMAYLSTEIKNKALCQIAEDLIKESGAIIAANKADYKEAAASGMNKAMLDRLLLTEDRIKAMAKDVLTVAAPPDPVGESLRHAHPAQRLTAGQKAGTVWGNRRHLRKPPQCYHRYLSPVP